MIPRSVILRLSASSRLSSSCFPAVSSERKNGASAHRMRKYRSIVSRGFLSPMIRPAENLHESRGPGRNIDAAQPACLNRTPETPLLHSSRRLCVRLRAGFQKQPAFAPQVSPARRRLRAIPGAGENFGTRQRSPSPSGNIVRSARTRLRGRIIPRQNPHALREKDSRPFRMLAERPASLLHGASPWRTVRQPNTLFSVSSILRKRASQVWQASTRFLPASTTFLRASG